MLTNLNNKMRIQLNDIHAQYLKEKRKVDGAISNVISDSAFIGGKYVEEFEGSFAHYNGSKFAVGLNSGTDALLLSILALGIDKGDEIITSPFTFFATAEVILRAGAKLRFADNGEDFNIDPARINKAITKKTRAIIPVHLFGHPARMNDILNIAHACNLFVIEDACQAVGATINDKKTGTFGNVGCFSFFPSKNLGAFGDGGAVITNNETLALEIKKLRNHGGIQRYRNEELGFNSRLDGIQAGILSAKLLFLDRWNKNRREAACIYRQLLSGCRHISLPPKDRSPYLSVYHQFTIRVLASLRDKLKGSLERAGVGTAIYYPTPLHLLPALKSLGYRPGDFPISEKMSQEVLSLPIFPQITLKQQRYVADQILNFFKTL